MTASGQETRTTTPPTTLRATGYIVLHYLLTYLGYYGLLSTLVVALTAASFNAGQIAALVFVFSLTNKVANIPLAPLLGRIPPAHSVLLGCVMAGIGFVGMRFASGISMTVTSLGFAGVGISINALASKQLAAAASDHIPNRARLFSFISIGVNVAAAVAAPVALFFVDRGHHGQVLLAVAAVYCVAGVVTFLRRATVHVSEHTARTPSLSVYRGVLREPGLRAFLLINLFYWFMYGQLYNALAAYVSETLHSPGRLGWLYTLNALLVVALQLAVTRLAGTWTKGRHLTTVTLSYATFAAAFVMNDVLPGFGGAVTFVVLFTVAEMMFVPSADVLIVRLIPQRNRAVGYSIFLISTALGEAVGGGTGVAAYRWLAERGLGDWFWLAATALAVALSLVTRFIHRSNASLRTLPAATV